MAQKKIMATINGESCIFRNRTECADLLGISVESVNRLLRSGNGYHPRKHKHLKGMILDYAIEEAAQK